MNTIQIPISNNYIVSIPKNKILVKPVKYTISKQYLAVFNHYKKQINEKQVKIVKESANKIGKTGFLLFRKQKRVWRGEDTTIKAYAVFLRLTESKAIFLAVLPYNPLNP